MYSGFQSSGRGDCNSDEGCCNCVGEGDYISSSIDSGVDEFNSVDCVVDILNYVDSVVDDFNLGVNGVGKCFRVSSSNASYNSLLALLIDLKSLYLS